jgi:hypothetical protein
MAAWSHLPNTRHIDRVLASASAHPEFWWTTSDVRWWEGTDLFTVYAQSTAAIAITNTIWKMESVRLNSTRFVAVRDAAFVLIAHDDCEQYLSMPCDQLEFIAGLSGLPLPNMLLPAVRAFEMEAVSV